MKKIAVYLLVLLCLFLPFSSYLVSFFTNPYLSLVRDFLIVLVFVLVLFQTKLSKWREVSTIFTVLLIVFTLLSYCWREASSLQWLRGARFFLLPIVLFLSVKKIEFSDSDKKLLLKAILAASLIVIIVAILEFLGVKIPFGSSDGSGFITDNNLVGGGIQIRRLQSLLAGPNAFGLFTLSIIGFAVGAFQFLHKKSYFYLILLLPVLILTFSRSAVVGCCFGFLVLIYLFLTKKVNKFAALGICLSAVLAISVISYFFINSSFAGFITHGDSTDQRVVQYERIWQTKFEIGLLGRGSGTAGPSSQYRLDGGPNHWTENVYLDTFEELGLIGLTLYLLLIFLVGFEINKIKRKDGFWQTAVFIFYGYLVAGLFINYYTGQVGLTFAWLAIGLSLNESNTNEKNFN